jgi:hypothetical protein
MRPGELRANISIDTAAFERAMRDLADAFAQSGQSAADMRRALDRYNEAFRGRNLDAALAAAETGDVILVRPGQYQTGPVLQIDYEPQAGIGSPSPPAPPSQPIALPRRALDLR